MAAPREDVLSVMTLIAAGAIGEGRSPEHGDYMSGGFTGGQIREHADEAERRARQDYLAELSLRRGRV